MSVSRLVVDLDSLWVQSKTPLGRAIETPIVRFGRCAEVISASAGLRPPPVRAISALKSSSGHHQKCSLAGGEQRPLFPLRDHPSTLGCAVADMVAGAAGAMRWFYSGQTQLQSELSSFRAVASGRRFLQCLKRQCGRRPTASRGELVARVRAVSCCPQVILI